MSQNIKLNRITGNGNSVTINNYYGIQPEQLQAIIKLLLKADKVKSNKLSNDKISGNNNLVQNIINTHK